MKLIGLRFFYSLDDEHFHRRFLLLQFQAELLLQRVEYRWP